MGGRWKGSSISPGHQSPLCRRAHTWQPHGPFIVMLHAGKRQAQALVVVIFCSAIQRALTASPTDPGRHSFRVHLRPQSVSIL